MTYSTGGLIQATDYNGFVSTTANANVNATLTFYGLSNLATTSAAATVTATQWATLNGNISLLANHQGTAITSRTNPVAGNVISVLANVNTDITNIYTNRYNANTTGTQYTAWTGNVAFTSGISNTAANTRGAWTATFTDTVTFANATAANTFFNGGGLVKIQFSKTSTGTTADVEWNNLIGTICGTVYLSGIPTAKTIAGTSYTGTTKIGGTGTPSVLATGTGYANLTTSPTTLYQQFDTSYSAYNSNYVQVNAAVSGSTLTLTTVWYDNGENYPAGTSTNITGGTNTTGITFGTAPATVVTYLPPETTYLTNVWGTPTVSSSIANT
jgi:hypothetical protein